jgi:uncharacterized protein (TIGR03067 family)
MKPSIRIRLGLGLLLALAFINGAPRMQRAKANEPDPHTAHPGATETKFRNQDSVADKAAFGPVIERLILHPGDSRTNDVLDLDTGKFLVAPPEVDDLLRVRFDEVTKSTRPVEPIIRWARSSGADLTLAMTSPDVALVLYEGLISPAGSFATTEPGEVLSIATETLHRRGGYDKPIPPMWMFQRPGPPHGDDAFVFRTREGSVGLLQIVGSKEKPRSATIRYKLLITAATEPPQEPSRELQIIRLQNLDSKDFLKTLKQLKLIDENLSVATPKPNLLVLRGKLSSINEALSLIERLDVPSPPVKVEAAAAQADKKIAVEGVLLELNQPGAILVVISLGTDDGVKPGDILTILRKGQRIGSVKIARAERDKSAATIMTVQEVKTLEVGDQVTNQTLPAGPPAPDRHLPTRQAPQNDDVQPKQAAITGVLSGRFVYAGTPPIAKDLYPAFAKLTPESTQERGPDGRLSGVEAVYREYLKHKIRPTTTDPSLRVGKDKGIADVVIWVVSKDIPWTPPAEGPPPVTVQIKNASFAPRGVALTIGQPLIIENHDPVNQSVSAIFSRTANPAFNSLLQAGSKDSSRRLMFTAAEPFPARIALEHCPWVRGLLFVHSNPYVAITQEDGSFRMPNLPIGEWEFQVWHPRSGFISNWPKGRFTHKITPGDNALLAIKLQPEQFVASAVDDAASLLGEWRVVAQESRGEAVDKFNFDGMRWTFGKETLDILPARINLGGVATKPVPKFSYSIDTSHAPAHLNWVGNSGEREESIEITGIYELKGNLLRVCFPQRGEPRPTGFATKGQKWTLYEFRRHLDE